MRRSCCSTSRMEWTIFPGQMILWSVITVRCVAGSWGGYGNGMSVQIFTPHLRNGNASLYRVLRCIEHFSGVRGDGVPCFGEPSLHAAFVGAPCQRGFARATQAWRRLMRTEYHAAFRVSLKTGRTASASPVRRFLHHPPDGAAAGMLFRGTPGMRRGISARDGALDGAPNERRMKGGIPETAPRHSDGWAIFFRNVRRTRYSDAVPSHGHFNVFTFEVMI